MSAAERCRDEDANWLHGLWGASVSSYADGFIGGNPAADPNFVYIADTTGTPAGDSTLFVNGLDFTVNPAPTGSPGRLGLSSGGMFPAEASDADISEVVIYNRVLNETELNDVRSFLYTKYSATILEPPAPTNTVLAGSIGTFTGGDPGEGLDLTGTFAYAINVGGPGGGVAGTATFTDGSNEGGTPDASINPLPSNQIATWHAPEYGDSANDQSIEQVMQSIRWNTPPGLTVDLDVIAGQPYKLQLLFAENCCDRGFDISVDGELVVDNFNIQVAQGGIANTAAGVVYSLSVTPEDGVLSIALGGSNPLAPDNNPILNGLTLEVVPEPSSVTLAVLSLVGLIGFGRRRNSAA